MSATKSMYYFLKGDTLLRAPTAPPQVLELFTGSGWERYGYSGHYVYPELQILTVDEAKDHARRYWGTTEYQGLF